MNKEIYIGSEHFLKLGKIKIDKNLITSINWTFRNPNFPEVFAGAQPKEIIKKKECNYSFELNSISKADFPFKKLKNNYYLVSEELSFEIPYKLNNSRFSIKLTYFEYLKIKYHKKQTLFHDINLKKEWLKFALFVVPSLFLGWLVKGCYEERTLVLSKNNRPEQQIVIKKNVIITDTLTKN